MKKFCLLLISLSWPMLMGAKPKSKDVDLATRERMIEISRQLGVTCTHCHNPNNFRSAEIPAFGVAKKHINMVKHINSAWSGHPQVDCYTCHKGSAKFQYLEPKEEAPHGAHAGKAKPTHEEKAPEKPAH